MSKVIPFEHDYASHPIYQERLGEIITELDRLEDEAINFCVNLATSGKWKKWDDGMKKGDRFHFTEKMLKDTGDPNVDALTNLVDTIIRTQEQLRNAIIDKKMY